MPAEGKPFGAGHYVAIVSCLLRPIERVRYPYDVPDFAS